MDASKVTYEIALGAQICYVRAYLEGRQIAHLSWGGPASSPEEIGEILDLWVNKDCVRNKIATTMLAKAREEDPGVRHSAARTRVGQVWAHAVRLPGEILPPWEPIADFDVSFS